MSTVDIESRILGTASTAVPAAKGRDQQPNAPRFDQILADVSAKANVKFSGHAQTRLASRRITLTDQDMTNLGNAITKAAAKGARESLVLTNKAAMVVSVPNRTVITAVALDDMKDNIFTNIDSAILL